MARFMLVLYDDPSQFRDVTPQQMQDIIQKYMAWSETMRSQDRLLGGEKLGDEGGKRLSPRSGKTTVVDGPYSESKEVIGGYYLLQANDYDEAVKLAKTCPHLEFGGTIDVRRIDEMPA